MSEENNPQEWPEELMPRSSGAPQNEGAFMPEEKGQPTESNQNINPPQLPVQQQRQGISTKAIVGIIIGVGCFIFTVIGILALIILLALSNARTKGKDARIKSDIEQCRTQAEVIYDNNKGNYSTADTNDPTIKSLNDDVASQQTDAAGIEMVHTAKAYKYMAHIASNPAIWYCVDSAGNVTTGDKPTATNTCK